MIRTILKVIGNNGLKGSINGVKMQQICFSYKVTIPSVLKSEISANCSPCNFEEEIPIIFCNDMRNLFNKLSILSSKYNFDFDIYEKNLGLLGEQIEFIIAYLPECLYKILYTVDNNIITVTRNEKTIKFSTFTNDSLEYDVLKLIQTYN